MNGRIHGLIGGVINGKVDTLGSLLNLPGILTDGYTEVYYDFTNQALLTVDSSNRVSAARSKIKQATATQVTLPNQPVFSSGLTFDGENDTLQTANIPLIAPPLTLYIVLKQNAYSPNDGFLDGLALGTLFLFQYSSSPKVGFSTNGTVDLIHTDKLQIGNYSIVTAVANGSESSLKVDEYNPVTGNVGNGTANGLTIGGAAGTTFFRANCSIKAIIVRRGVDTSGTQNVIRAWLRKTFLTANLIAISGQSNAIGYYPDSALPASANGNQGEKFIYFKPLTGDLFQIMNPAVNCGYDNRAEPKDNTGWGAEQGAAIDLLSETKNDVVVVKSGYNGGAIGEWDAGKPPFTELVDGLKRALDNNDALVQYKYYERLSLLWMQGETDAINSVSTATYEAKMRNLIARLRASDPRLSGLQIVMLKLSNSMTAFSLDATKRGRINTAFTNIAANTVNTIVLDPDLISGVVLRADALHYTAASLLLIGSAWRDVMV